MTSTGAERTFFDTNVLVYMFDGADPTKQDQALTAFASVDAESTVISAQVLAEFANAAARLEEPLSHDDIDAALESFARLPTVSLTAELVLRARRIRREASVSHWDAQIVAAAERAGCSRILTEDLSSGQRIAGVLIESPFV